MPGHRPSPPPDPPNVQLLFERAFAALERFLHVEAASGVVLLVAAAAALIWANSPFSHGYHTFWELAVPLRWSGFTFTRSLHFWINDALMTVFFLVVGLEIRREIYDGALSDPRQALLPVMAAVGGVALPALFYLSLNGTPVRGTGWAVPTATDIAFAVGVLALLGRAIPANVRVFLLALAIIDDIIAVLIIALFYSGGLDYHGFLVAGLGLLLVLGFHRLDIRSAWPYVLPGAITWAGLLMTGAHPTLSGVVLGMMTPVAAPRGSGLPAPVQRVQAALHPWVAYGIMPLFALANAGVSLGGMDLSATDPLWVMAGVALALVAGKPLGVIGMSRLLVWLGWCRLPPGVSWGGIGLIGLLAGIGFTMSIFIGMLAFTDTALLDAAKLGVLAGSLTAGLLGLAWGAVYRRGIASVPPGRTAHEP